MTSLYEAGGEPLARHRPDRSYYCTVLSVNSTWTAIYFVASAAAGRLATRDPIRSSPSSSWEAYEEGLLTTSWETYARGRTQSVFLLLLPDAPAVPPSQLTLVEAHGGVFTDVSHPAGCQEVKKGKQARAGISLV